MVEVCIARSRAYEGALVRSSRAGVDRFAKEVMLAFRGAKVAAAAE
jgi:hypothetical protein